MTVKANVSTRKNVIYVSDLPRCKTMGIIPVRFSLNFLNQAVYSLMVAVEQGEPFNLFHHDALKLKWYFNVVLHN